MTSSVALGSSVAYSGAVKSVQWEGRDVEHHVAFERYMREVVGPRVTDEASSFVTELRGLATTGVEVSFVERLLHAVPVPEGWEVGEAFAECALRDDADRRVHWPWNMVRDRRTPRANLPGADLVGFLCDGQEVLLLIGEVKTSSDTRTPPSVMSGHGGMAWQLENVMRTDVQLALLQWLYARCRSEHLGELYRKAVERYLESEGQALVLVGVLLRDTQSSELDLKARGEALSHQIDDPTRVDLIAWYLPLPIPDWPALVQVRGS